MKDRPVSEELTKALLKLIPGGVNSPVRSCAAVGISPLIASYGKGATLFDADDNPYIDYCCSWGALIHGHAHPEIVKAIQDAAAHGSSFGVTTPLEEKLARKIVQLIPSIEMVRFVSSGTEATMSAIRLARGYTGRDLIVKFDGHYHGHADFFLISAGSGALELQGEPSSKGVPQGVINESLSIPFNDPEALEELFANEKIKGRIAAVILEPIAGNMGVVKAQKEWIDLLRNLTEKNGTVLIFDEVMTGFRVAKGGAQSLYGIVPDLTCLGKIVGGGVPVAAFGGKKEIMHCLAPLGPVYQAGTLSGNPLAMAAGLKSLELLEVEGFYEELQRKTSLITDPVKNFILQEGLDMCLQEEGSMFSIFFGRKSVENGAEAKSLDKELFGQFFRAVFDEGIYIPPLQQEAWFVSMAHTDAELTQTKDAILEFLSSICYARK